MAPLPTTATRLPPRLAGERCALLGVSLPPQPARSVQARTRFFGAPVHTDKPFAALHLWPAMLNVPVHAARPTLLRIAADQLQCHVLAPDLGVAALRYSSDTGYATAEVAGGLGFYQRSAFTWTCRGKLGGTPTEIRARRRV